MKEDNKIAILLFSLIALTSISIGLTVSFYASGQDLGQHDLNISLVSDPTLEIGIADENEKIVYYQNEVPQDALKNYLITEFNPVSSMYSSLDNSDEYPTFRERYTNVNKDETSSFKESSVALDGYFSIPIYLRSDSDVYLTLDEDTYILEDNEINKTKVEGLRSRYPLFNDEEILNGLNNIKKSMRIGLYDSINHLNYIIDPYKDGETAYFGVLDIISDQYFDTFIDENSEKEILYGEYQNEDKLVYEYVSESSRLPLKELNTFNANVKSDTYHINFEKSLENGFVGSYENSLSLDEVVRNDEFIVLNHDIPHKFILSIYIEGWDKDNIGISEYGAFLSLIKFKVTKEYIV